MSSQFIDYLQDVFGQFGTLSYRKMFGGYGMFYEGLMIGLIIDEQLYLKARPSQKAELESIGLMPFSYRRQGKTIYLGYFQAPEAIFEDQELACRCASQAFEAALAAKS